MRPTDKRDGSRPTLPGDADSIVEMVRERYGEIAEGRSSGCCGPTCGEKAPSVESEVARRVGYDATQIESVPDGTNLGLGCGAPIPALRLKPGEVVLDLGSGAGFDAFIAAPLVGATGRVIGVDMTEAMVRRARSGAERAGTTQVEFRLGRLEELPVESASIDAVTSNCVFNLVPDKRAVFREIARVLRPGGRLVVSDIVLDGELPAALARDLLAYVGCVSGAMQRERYFDLLRESGLGEIRVLHDVDYLASVGDLLPDEVRELMRASGSTLDDVAGTVRSVTYRAVKPS